MKRKALQVRAPELYKSPDTLQHRHVRRLSKGLTGKSLKITKDQNNACSHHLERKILITVG